jgi:hypothetical protein
MKFFRKDTENFQNSSFPRKIKNRSSGKCVVFAMQCKNPEFGKLLSKEEESKLKK